MAFLSANSIPFSTPVDDPWYSAHSKPFEAVVNSTEIGDSSETAGTGTVYFRDRPVSVLACTEQYQLCALKSSPECTPLTSLGLLDEAVENLNLNKDQAATAGLLLSSIVSNLVKVIQLLGTSSLLARNSKSTSIQGPLPSNQWTLEVESWNQMILADMQRAVLEYAAGSSSLEVLPFLEPPNGSEWTGLCHNQRARSSQAQNFSVLAISIILVLGLLIICINLGLHRLVSHIQHEKDLRDHRRLAWKSNGLFQIQRLAHEEAGFGTWSRCAKKVPVTALGETLAMLDVSDPEHPVLLRNPMSPNQPVYPASGTTQTENAQTRNAIDFAALSSESEPKATIEVQETGENPFPTRIIRLD